MKKLIVFVVMVMMLTACHAVNVSVPETVATPTATVEASAPDLGSTVQAAVNATLTAQPKSPEATSTPTAIVLATSVATEATSVSTEAAPTGLPVIGNEVSSFTTGKWNVITYKGVTDQIAGWGKDLKDPVLDWSEFPNVDFPKYSFKAADGVEYGMAESAFCQQGQTCDVNVPAMHYRLITGDYAITGVDECKKATDKDPGCGIILINVGGVTAMFRDQHVDYGFTVEGRYWNGDAMPVTIWALSSNTLYNMLNQAGDVNMGANCSVYNGCQSVRIAVVIMSGNQILLKATTTVAR